MDVKQSEITVRALEISEEVCYGTINDGNIDVLTKDTKKVSKLCLTIILICSFTNVFLSALDSTIVSTLLSVIAGDLESMDNISWVATSYLLSCAAFQPIFGKLSDVFGRKIIILNCTIIFGIGCLICGLSNTLWCLVFGRFITGIGGGGLGALATITVSDVIEVRQRGLYQGYMNIFYYIGAATGGVVAGIIQSISNWRMAFLIQVPICILSGSMVYFFFKLPEGSSGLGLKSQNGWIKLKNLDLIGSFLLVSSLFLLMLTTSIGGKEIDFDSFLFVILFLSSIFGLVVFYYYDLKIAKEPIIPVELLHVKSILFSCFCCWFTSMNMFSSIFFIPFYWSSVKNLTSLECGIRLIPSSIFSSIGSLYAGYVIKKTSKYGTLKFASGLILIAGSILVCFSSKEDSPLHDSLISVPLRYSTSSIITIILVAMISSVSSEQQALVTSIQYGFRSTGSTLGVSLASAILQFNLRRNIESKFELLDVPDKYKSIIPQIKLEALKNPNYSFTQAPKFCKDAIIGSYDSAGQCVFLFLLSTAVLTFVASLFVEENPLDESENDS